MIGSVLLIHGWMVMYSYVRVTQVTLRLMQGTI